ncbi:MAG: hypothetical protein WD267_06760 [Balneolales bacterium]
MADEINKDELLRKFLDRELNSQQEAEALHLIADDEDMRDMLHFDRSLYQSFNREADPESFSVPDEFAENVMSKISLPETVSSALSWWGSVEEFLAGLITPRPVAVRPVFAMMVIMIIAATMTWPYLQNNDTLNLTNNLHETSTERVAVQDQQVWIRFVYFDDEATSLAVAGDFSDWDPISLTKEVIGDRQIWTGLIPVEKKEQRYMFVKDGEQWVTDPLAEVQRDDGFGNKNAVLFL